MLFSQAITGDDENDIEDLVELEGEFVKSSGLTEAEELIVNQFLRTDPGQMRTLADIIIDKLRERSDVIADAAFESPTIPPKVVHVYSSVGKLLQHYKSGKLPKALKMLPHLKNWEVIASARATFEVIYESNVLM